MKGYVYILLVLFLLSSCGNQDQYSTIESEKSLLSTQIVATITAESFQISPVITSQPTETQISPTGTPVIEPLIISGSGDSVVDIDKPVGLAIAHITGNQESRFFSVKNYDINGNGLDLLVNTTDVYDGVRPLDFDSDEHTTRFEITSSGDWKIEVLSISSSRIVQVPGIVEGFGDEVIILEGEDPDLAIIRGNNESRYFGVISYSINGSYLDLHVNTTDPYEGTVILDSDTKIFEIKSSGKWEIEITSK